MPMRIRCRNKRPLNRKRLRLKGLSFIIKENRRRLIWAGNQNSAPYADQSNYCSARGKRK
jgi:hypothetical protein